MRHWTQNTWKGLRDVSERVLHGSSVTSLPHGENKPQDGSVDGISSKLRGRGNDPWCYKSTFASDVYDETYFPKLKKETTNVCNLNKV